MTAGKNDGNTCGKPTFFCPPVLLPVSGGDHLIPCPELIALHSSTHRPARYRDSVGLWAERELMCESVEMTRSKCAAKEAHSHTDSSH